MNVTSFLEGHSSVEIFGLRVNDGTLRSSALAAAVVVGAGFWARRRITTGRPGAAQLAWETVIGSLDRRLETSTGKTRTAAVPLAISLFGFILVANCLRVIPGSSGWLPTAAADLNLTMALAIVVTVIVHTASIRSRGLRGYARHYFEPYWWLAPLNLLEEIVRPVTLALRLFGTAFAGGLVIALIGELIPPALAPVPHAIWALFDLAIGALQAVIYALLALLYYEAAVGTAPTTAPACTDDGRHLVTTSEKDKS